MPLPVTAMVTAGSAILLLILAIDTIRRRLQLKQAFGDGGNASLTSAIRAHGNLAEHAPIVIIMIGLLEQANADGRLLWWIGVAFLAGRVAHVIGLHTPSQPGKAPLGRQIGVVTTFGTIAVLAGLLVVGLL